MAKLIVAVDIPNLTDEKLKHPDWWKQTTGRIMIDEAYLRRSNEDDSFFAFEFIALQKDEEETS